MFQNINLIKHLHSDIAICQNIAGNHISLHLLGMASGAVCSHLISTLSGPLGNGLFEPLEWTTFKGYEGQHFRDMMDNLGTTLLK